MFLNCLVDNPLFMETLQTCADKEFDGTGMDSSSENVEVDYNP